MRTSIRELQQVDLELDSDIIENKLINDCLYSVGVRPIGDSIGRPVKRKIPVHTIAKLSSFDRNALRFAFYC